MNKNIIKKYSYSINKENIINYLKKENIPFNNEEINIIYDLIHNKAEHILNNNFYEVIDDYQNKFNPILFKKIIEKYNEYKKFID